MIYFRAHVARHLVATLLAALAITGAAPAQPSDDLYRATTIVTGTDMRSRPNGFAECLRQVLVRLTGDPRLRDDPRVAGLAAHADALVAGFDYVDPRAAIRHHDDQGTYDRSYDLTVQFNPAKIDAALAGLGEHPWFRERPVVVPVLAVRGDALPHGQDYLLTVAIPAGAIQRDSFAHLAGIYGVAVRFPTSAEFAAWGVTPDHVPEPPPESAPDAAIIVGTLDFQPAALGWVGAWRMRWRGANYAWGVGGVGFDVAFDNLLRGVVRVASGHGAPE